MKLSFPSFAAAFLVGQGHAAKPLSPFHLDAAVESDDKQLRMAPGDGGCPGFEASNDAKAAPVSSLYIMNNQPENGVQAYFRDQESGQLTSIGTFGTTGTGSLGLPVPVNGVASTDSVIVAGGCVLAVNAGSDDVSALTIDPATGELAFAQKVASGGTFPVSIAHRDGLVYVLNASGQGHLQAFSLLQDNCHLTAIGAPVELTQGGTVLPQDASTPGFAFGSPSQVGFDPQGRIVVTIKRNGGIAQEVPFGSINVYDLSEDGTTSAAALTQTIVVQNGAAVVWGFDFDGAGNLLVVDGIGAEGGGQVAVFGGEAYETELQPLVNTGQGGSCWIEYSARSGCVWTTNTGSATFQLVGNTITSLRADDSGTYSVVEEVEATLNRPLDLKLSPDGKFLYVVSNISRDNTGTPLLYVYETTCDCGLIEVQATNDGFGEPVRDVPFNQNGLGGGTEVGCAVYPASL